MGEQLKRLEEPTGGVWKGNGKDAVGAWRKDGAVGKHSATAAYSNVENTVSNEWVDLTKEISRRNIKSSNWFLLTQCDKTVVKRNKIEQENVQFLRKFRGNINKPGFACSKTEIFPTPSFSGWGNHLKERNDLSVKILRVLL